MRKKSALLAIGLSLFGCDAGLRVGAEPPIDVGLDVIVLDARIDGGLDLGVDLGPTVCDDLCRRYRRACRAASLVVNCDQCADVLAADTEPRRRAAALCGRATGATCGAWAACLSDDDGLVATGTGAVQIEGLAFERPLSLSDPTAFVAVRAKGSGGPSDLELHLSVDGAYWRLRFDELAVAPGVLDAADAPVTLEGVADRLELEIGTIDATGFTLDGPFRIEGQLETGLMDEVVVISIDGVLSR